MFKLLQTLPKDKMPPCAIYAALVNLTGQRNSWTVQQWLEFLQEQPTCIVK